MVRRFWTSLQDVSIPNIVWISLDFHFKLEASGTLINVYVQTLLKRCIPEQMYSELFFSEWYASDKQIGYASFG